MLPKTELALRNLGPEFVTPWRVEQCFDLASHEFLSQFVFSFSPLWERFSLSPATNVCFFSSQNLSWQDEPNAPP
jgi:hypothetical protein